METIDSLLRSEPAPAEILLVDQTPQHDPETTEALTRLEGERKIRWIRLQQPSITRAMNVGLEQARGEIVLFLDDDIIPHANLLAAHAGAHREGCNVVAGQVLQPGEEPLDEAAGAAAFLFRSARKQLITELMGGNFSIERRLALGLGGFDENFVHVAYRFEAEFAERVLAAGERIVFEPGASIRHLKASRGGTRSYGHHLTTVRPSHAVGAYYYLLRSRTNPHRFLNILRRPLRAVKTRHHLSRPWWIFPTLLAECAGLLWAACLAFRGPRLIKDAGNTEVGHG